MSDLPPVPDGVGLHLRTFWAEFVRWARRGVIVQGGTLCREIMGRGDNTWCACKIIEEAEALGWLKRASYEPTREQLFFDSAGVYSDRRRAEKDAARTDGLPRACYSPDFFSWEVSLTCPLW